MTKMSNKKYLHVKCAKLLICLCLCLSLCSVCFAGTENLTNANLTILNNKSTSSSSSSQAVGTRTILRIYDECSRLEGDFVPCLKKKAIFFLDRLAHIDAITVAEGIKLVRTQTSLNSRHISDNDVESTLLVQRSAEDRDSKLTSMLIERLSHFFSAHSLQVNFPKLSTEEIGRGLEEGLFT